MRIKILSGHKNGAHQSFGNRLEIAWESLGNRAWKEEFSDFSYTINWS